MLLHRTIYLYRPNSPNSPNSPTMLPLLRTPRALLKTRAAKRWTRLDCHVRSLSSKGEVSQESLQPSSDENFQPLPRSREPPELSEHLEIPPAEDPLLGYITAALIRDGKLAQAQRTTANTLTWIHALTRAEPLPIFRHAILQVAPAVRTKVRRHGSKTIVKPVALGEKQRVKFAVQWLLEASKSKTGRTAEERLARELVAVIQGNSSALKKKEEVHTLAMVNRLVLCWLITPALLNCRRGNASLRA